MSNSLGFFTITGESIEGLRHNADDIIAALGKDLPDSGPWASSVILKELNIIDTPLYEALGDLTVFRALKTGLGTGIDFSLGFVFQYLEDVQNPYLNQRQITSRALISGSGGALFALVAVAACPETAGIGCAVAAGTAGGVTWSLLIQNPFFELLEHRIFAPYGVHILPGRNLRPLEE
jgi:hypothetical protein